MEGHDHLNSKIEAEETETSVSRVSGFSLRDETPKQNLDSKRVKFRFFPFRELGFCLFLFNC